MRKRCEIPEWLLSAKEEAKLTPEEKSDYCKKMREFCRTRKLTNTTKGATTIAPYLKKPTNAIVKVVTKALAGGEVEMITDGLENFRGGPAILTCTHQGVLDNFSWISSCPRHTLIFHSLETKKLMLMIQVNTGLILVTKKKENASHRIGAKLDVISALLKGESVIIFPETAWNLSPNKLHLPMNYGFLDMAQKAKADIMPMVMEYTYDTSTDKEKITRIHIRYGEPVVVGENDDFTEKLAEYQEKISTMRWELIEEKGLYKRSEISNTDYINFVKGNLRNLQMGEIDINNERNGIFSSRDEFWKFYPINDVAWDAWGNLLQTEEVEKLKKLNRVHGI